MNSMTGYGKSVAESDGRKITVEMKSVNHRFLDVTVKLPKVLSFAEDAVRRVIIDNFKRGHFDVYVTYENTKNDGVELSVNEEVAKEYLKIKDVLCDKYGVQDDFTVTALMRTADVIETKTVEEDEDALKFLIESATSGASEQMKKMRAFEGEKLRNDILKKVSVIESTVGEIRSIAPETVVAYREKLKERITEALNGVQIDEARLLNEVAFYSDKVSIDEEITRLNSHCGHLRKMLDADLPMGKNMDFLVQEFNREANTIGSKCNDIRITERVLVLKNEIEKSESRCKMSNNANMISIGFDNYVNFDRVIAVLAAGDPQAKKHYAAAKEERKLLDVSTGRKVRTVIILDNGFVFLSALTPETITDRAKGKEENE